MIKDVNCICMQTSASSFLLTACWIGSILKDLKDYNTLKLDSTKNEPLV